MSIVRWGFDGSQVYLTYSERGLECVGCSLGQGDGFLAQEDRPLDMVAHLEEHRGAGQVVPQWVINVLASGSISATIIAE